MQPVEVVVHNRFLACFSMSAIVERLVCLDCNLIAAFLEREAMRQCAGGQQITPAAGCKAVGVPGKALHPRHLLQIWGVKALALLQDVDQVDNGVLLANSRRVLSGLMPREAASMPALSVASPDNPSRHSL